jgi:hypothetical protein
VKPEITTRDTEYYAAEAELYPVESSIGVIHARSLVEAAIKELWIAASAEYFNRQGRALKRPRVAWISGNVSWCYSSGLISLCPGSTWLTIAHEFGHALQFALHARAGHNESHRRLCRWAVHFLRRRGFALASLDALDAIS